MSVKRRLSKQRHIMEARINTPKLSLLKGGKFMTEITILKVFLYTIGRGFCFNVVLPFLAIIIRIAQLLLEV